jgi:NAD(P)-dependent dehydrogenase (short-subunit alcohol dehydrogenase family)
MAKAGIIALTRLYVHEFGKYGVVTNCFLPVTFWSTKL